MRITQLFPGILAICYLGALSIPRHAWQDPGKIMSLTCSFHLFLSAYKKFTQSLYSFQIYWQIAATKHFGCAQTCLTTSKKKWNNQFVAHIHVCLWAQNYNNYLTLSRDIGNLACMTWPNQNGMINV